MSICYTVIKISLIYWIIRILFNFFVHINISICIKLHIFAQSGPQVWSLFSHCHTVWAIKAWCINTKYDFWKYLLKSFNKLFHFKVYFPANISHIKLYISAHYSKEDYDNIFPLSEICHQHVTTCSASEMTSTSFEIKKSMHITRHFIFHIFPTWFLYWMSCFTPSITCNRFNFIHP